MQKRVAAESERERKESSAGLELPSFEVGDDVLYARVRRPGVTPKLMATGTGPWRVVGAHHPHLFEIQNIVSGRVHTAHVARLRFYADFRRCQECVSTRVQSGAISDGWCCPRGESRRSFADRVGRLGWF